ncbi:MAG: hypothetical protein Ta2F_12170 [Termitinemataceae bacterium]|nr:MAG: hypothetical protein Ta2F_12170 [Termitinemataceae bacterium]
MEYREKQREIAVKLIENAFFESDKGGAKFANGHNYPFVLQDPKLNLWEGIKNNALEYFETNNIPWWMSTPKTPTGHTLSSQVACVNHLYLLRNKQDLATAVLKNINNKIVSAVEIKEPDTDAGYVAFEIVGEKNYLGEIQHTRGANATSVDAVMVGKKADCKNILVLIEWKYTEYYKNKKSLYKPARAQIYNKLLSEQDSPFKNIEYQGKLFEPLYYKLYYELMRQNLLGWQMVKAGEYGCDEFIHLYIVPEGNKELRVPNTSPGLSGKDMFAAWHNTLKEPQKSLIITPEELLSPIEKNTETKDLLKYIRERYWQ